MDGKRIILFLYLVFVAHFTHAQKVKQKTATNDSTKSPYYVNIKDKAVLDEIKNYLKEYEKDFTKHGLPILVINKYEDSTIFYISAIIYRSDLDKYIGNYYTVVNNIPVLVYCNTNKILEDVYATEYFRELFSRRLLNDLDKNGNVNSELIPVGFDPHNMKIKEVEGKLQYKNTVSMLEVYDIIRR